MARFFRYRSVNAFMWQELELSELYFCRPTELNDAFDCQLNWRGSIQRALASSTVDDARRKTLQLIGTALGASDLISKLGVCCFTDNAEDHLMWAHYADAHRGVCLMYEIPVDFAANKYPDGDFYFVGSSSVSYGGNPFFDWLTTGDLAGLPVHDAPVNAVTKLITFKADSWAHEHEYRMLMSKPGRLQLEPQFLSQVIFGMNTSDEHKKKIRQIAERRNANVTLSRVTRSPTSDFGLEFSEIK